MSKADKKNEELFDVKMHGVFACFAENVSKEVYEAALKRWPCKMKIRNQVLAAKAFRRSGRTVLVRVFPGGKVSFIIRASEKPVKYNTVCAIYNRICRDLRNIMPSAHIGGCNQFIISRADVHIDSFFLPELYPVVPIPGTVISIHKVKSKVGTLVTVVFRVEVRGPYDDALKTLVRLLGIRSCTL